MSYKRKAQRRTLSIAGAILLAGLVLPQTAFALTVDRAELSGDEIRIEGQDAVNDADITVDGSVLGLADDRGDFKVRTAFAPASCDVVVSDGADSVTATLSGCSAAPAPDPAPDPTPDPTPPPPSGGDFTFNPNFASTGNLVRDGLVDEDCAPPSSCVGGLVQPKYLLGSFSCFWSSNTLGMVSLDGFSGDVTISLQSGPAGVSMMPMTITVPDGGAVVTALALDADLTGAGTGTVTGDVVLLASGGGVEHTLTMAMSIADSLPPIPCDNPPTVHITEPLGGDTVSGDVLIVADIIDDRVATDGLAAITVVDFRVDGFQIGTLAGGQATLELTADPDTLRTTMLWDSSSMIDGPHELDVRLVDNATPDANVTGSPFVDFIVANGNPQGLDTITVSGAQCKSGKDEVRITASSDDPGANLTAQNTSGTVSVPIANGGQSRFTWPAGFCPSSIAVVSDLGGRLTVPVQLK